MLGETIHLGGRRVVGFGDAPQMGSKPPTVPSSIASDALFVRAVPIPPFVSRGDTLLPGQSLARGEALTTKNGGVLLMQPGGNLVLYGSVDVYKVPVPEKHKGQYFPLWWTSGGSPATKAVFNRDGSFYLVDDKGTKFYDANSKGAVKLVFQTDGNAVWYDKNGKAVAYTVTNNWAMNPALRPKSSTGAFDTITEGFSQAGADIGKIPVVGDAVKIVGEAAAAPFKIAGAIASGERLDHVALGALKDQIKIIKDVAPYATTVVSLVPGIGTGVAAAIGAGAALVQGQSITAAVKNAIRSAIPGGALAQTGFDLATKVASGESVTQAALEAARASLPATAQKAFDIGLAVVTGEKLQTALAHGLASFAPEQAKAILDAGEKALDSTPGLKEALKKIPVGAAQQGFQIAAGLMGQSNMNAKVLATVRNQIPADMRPGFDAMLKTQETHVPWVKDVASGAVPPVIPPKIAEPTKRAPTSTPGTTKITEPPKKEAAKMPAPKIHEPETKRKKLAGKYAPYPPHARAGTMAGVGAFLDSSAWRWFAVYANGKPVAQRGPLWLSNDGAQLEAASFLEATQGRNYIGTVAQWNWDPSAQRWRQAPSGALSDAVDAPPHGGGGGGHGGGHGGGGGGHGGHGGGHHGPPHGGGGGRRRFDQRRFVKGGWGWGWGNWPWWSTPWVPEVVTTTCQTWGDPIAEIPPSMQTAAKAALGASSGRPTTVRGPDGELYLFAYENGAITVRPCAATAAAS